MQSSKFIVYNAKNSPSSEALKSSLFISPFFFEIFLHLTIKHSRIRSWTFHLKWKIESPLIALESSSFPSWISQISLIWAECHPLSTKVLNHEKYHCINQAKLSLLSFIPDPREHIPSFSWDQKEQQSLFDPLKSLEVWFNYSESWITQPCKCWKGKEPINRQAFLCLGCSLFKDSG